MLSTNELMDSDGRPGNGGAAFPTPANPPNYGPCDGMTLRDWFAGQAMVGLLSADVDCVMPADDVAKSAYLQADMMLSERER